MGERSMKEDAGSRAPVIYGADPQQERDLRALHYQMFFLLERQFAGIRHNTQRANGQYGRTFGAFTPARYQFVTDTLQRIVDSLRTHAVVYELSDPAGRCGRSGDRFQYGYVLPETRTIFLCASEFFARPLSGNVSQPGNLFFLLALAIAGLDPTDKGRQGAFDLAASDPDAAIRAALNYTVNFELTPYHWAGNRQIEVPYSFPKSNSNPGLVSYERDGHLYAIYKGESSNDLYCAKYSRGGWFGNEKITISGASNPKSNYSPNVVDLEYKLYTVYKGESSTDLYFASYDGTVWSGNRTIREAYGRDLQSDFNPGMATYDKKVYIVYRRPGNAALHYSSFDGTGWAEEQEVRVNGIAVASDRNPRLVVYDDKIYMIFKGQGSNPNGVYYAYFDGTSWHGNETFVVSGNDEPVTTFDSPGVAVLDDILHIMLRPAGKTDFDLYEITFNRAAYSDRLFRLGFYPVSYNSEIVPKSDQSPNLAAYQGRLYMVYKGFDNTELYCSFQ